MGRLKTLPQRLVSASGRLAPYKAPDASRQARRDMPTNSARWRAIRAHQLHIEPLCNECAKGHRDTAANTCDHIDGDCNNNPADGSNYQSLCSPCHSRKTAAEDGGFGNTRQ